MPRPSEGVRGQALLNAAEFGLAPAWVEAAFSDYLKRFADLLEENA